MPYGQSAFRFRTDDSETLNSNSGWEAAVNTNVTMVPGKRFRLRIEVEETLGNGTSQAYDIEYRVNGGSWTAFSPGYGGESSLTDTSSNRYPVRVVYSSITDGAATTELITSGGSSQTFTAGNGNDVDDTTAAVTINNACSEFEWALYLAPWELAHNDTIEFRMVLTGGTAFTEHYNQIPQVTVTNNVGEVGGVLPETIIGVGPWKDGNGDWYTLVEMEDTPISRAVIMKSTNQGLTWVGKATSTDAQWADWEACDYAVSSDGHTVILAHHRSAVHFWIYRMDSHPTNPDTWLVEDQVIHSHTAAFDCVSLAWRSDDTIICAYSTSTSPGRVAYKIRTDSTATGTWGSENIIDTEASTDFEGVQLVLGASDKTHFFYNDQTNGRIYHRALNSSDAWTGAREQCNDTASLTAHELPIVPKPIYWDDGGNEKIMVAWQDSSDKIRTSIITNDGTPAAEQVASDNTVTHDTASSEQPSASLVVLGSTPHLLYSDLTSNDLYHTSWSTTWATDDEIDDAVTNLHFFAMGLDATTIGYVWSESSTGTLDGRVYFDTVSFDAPTKPTSAGVQTIIRRSPTIRM